MALINAGKRISQSRRSHLTLKQRLKFIDKIEDIPSMPVVVMNVVTKLNDPKVTYKELNETISLDPGLVSYILRVINSPFYGLRSEILTIPKAIAILGVNNLKSLLVAYGVRHMYKKISDQAIQEKLWKHSVSVGVLAKVISEVVYKVVHSEAYVLGLLHDIGKIVLLMFKPEKFKKSVLAGEDAEGNSSVEREYKVFGFSHIEAGFFLLSKFRFPKHMKDVVLFHHDPEFSPEGDNLIWIVSLANKLSYFIFDKVEENFAEYFEQLNLDEIQLEKIIDEGQNQIEKYLNQF